MHIFVQVFDTPDTYPDMNNDKEKNINSATEAPESAAVSAAHRSPVWVWVAVVLALAAWVTLMWVDGYVALGLGVAGIVSGFVAARRNEFALRRLAIAAIIASMVLVVVLAAFLIVIKIGLSQ